MPLVLDTLKSGLERNWLAPEGGSYPDSVLISGDHFAGAIVNWFSAAQAAGFPCPTAMTRRTQLASAAAGALSTGAAPAAGAMLALAVASYIAGQMFGTGVASFPSGINAAVLQLASTFDDKGGSVSQKAEQIASACTLLANTTLVIFPPVPPLPPAPIT
jgi:hypothetical protein